MITLKIDMSHPFGDQIAEIRMVSLDQASKATGVNRMTIHSWEQNKRMPDLNTLWKYVSGMGINKLIIE